MLSEFEKAAIEALDNSEGKGIAVSWDEEKTVAGVVARDVETITFKDKNDGKEKTKKVLTLRTEDGLVSVFEGPTALNSRLFEGKKWKDDEPLGPPVKDQLVIIKYLGEGLTAEGKDFKRFDVHRGDLPAAGNGKQAETPTGGDVVAGTTDDDIPF
jgi:hypothetical protein